MTTRKTISKSIRFEVLKRDSFACQYCGRKAPDVLLEVDHIQPVSKGGTNDLLNLITACADCNEGKSDRVLSDSTVLDRQRRQLKELQDRREQIELMFRWQKGLLELDDQVARELTDFWLENVPGTALDGERVRRLKCLKQRFGLEEVIAAIRIAADQYVQFENGEPTRESVDLAWTKLGGICAVRREQTEWPHMRRLRYIRGILRNRLSYIDERRALRLLDEAYRADVDLDSLEDHAKEVRSWTEWRTGIEKFIQSQRPRQLQRNRR